MEEYDNSPIPHVTPSIIPPLLITDNLVQATSLTDKYYPFFHPFTLFKKNPQYFLVFFPNFFNTFWTLNQCKFCQCTYLSLRGSIDNIFWQMATQCVFCCVCGPTSWDQSPLKAERLALLSRLLAPDARTLKVRT